MTKIPEVANEVDMFMKKWVSVPDELLIAKFYNWGGAIKNEQLDFNHHKIQCEYLWNEMRITWDGDIPLCCWDYESTIKLGNAKNTSLCDV